MWIDLFVDGGGKLCVWLRKKTGCVYLIGSMDISDTTSVFVKIINVLIYLYFMRKYYPVKSNSKGPHSLPIFIIRGQL